MTRTGARRHWLVWAAVIPILAWAAVRVLGLERGFVLVPLMAYTPYAALAALLVTGVAIALRNWAAGATAAIATACLLGAVLPRAFGSGAEAPPGAARLDVLSANIHLGGARPATLMALVERHDPDILSIQELTLGYTRKLREAGIERRLPHAVLSLEWMTGGAGIYSRFPLRRIEWGAPYGLRMPRAQARLPGGREVRIVNVHPHTPKRRLLDRWHDGLASLPRAGTGAPWVLAGDFNATLDHAELRDVIGTGYRDAGDALGKGLVPTWPKGRLFPPPITIDHVLADRRLGVARYAVEDLPGSDHRAVYAQLVLP